MLSSQPGFRIYPYNLTFETVKTCRFLALLGLVLLSLPALAERPKIGLALAGGGAKGSAHIAVLELLEANNIPVDYIAGTSIGAYVGGLYALGYPAAEIREIMYGAGLERGFSDSIDRSELPYRIKRQADKFNLGLEAGYRDGTIRFPLGLLYGQTMSTIYRSSVGNLPNFESFDDLATPFRAVATDLATSEAVVLASGNLVKAMQASATVPGALVPVELDGKYLVDGGIAENLPVSQVRRMGADIVIAVDVSSPPLDIEKLENTLEVLEQISNFLTLQNIEAQKKQLTSDDVYIRPEVDALSTTDFSNLSQAYEAGKIGAEKSMTELKKLSIDAQDYQRYQQDRRDKLIALQLAAELPVEEIVLNNRSSFKSEFLRARLGLKSGAPISIEELIEAVDRLYALDKFERVEVAIEQHGQSRTLIIDVNEKSWGPNYLEMGLGWEDDFTLDSIINIDFAYTIGNITANNGEWRNEIGIGTDKSLRSELYLPLDDTQDYYQSTVFSLRRESRDFFVENQPALVFDRDTYRLDLGLGRNFWNAGIIEVGITVDRGEFSNAFFIPEALEYTSPGVYFRIGYDTLDRSTFPTRGSRFSITVAHRDEDVSGLVILGDANTDEVYRSTQYLIDWKAALRIGNQVLIGKTSFAYVDSEIDQSIHYTELGGFLNLSGYHKNALIGNHKVFGALAYQYDLGKSLFGLSDFPVYLGISIEAGNVWAAADSIQLDELIAAGSLFVGTDSKLGPIALGVGYTEDGNSSVYLYLGKNI